MCSRKDFDRPAVLGTVVVEVGVPVVIIPTPPCHRSAEPARRVYRVGGLVFVALIFPVVVVMMIVMMLIMVLVVCVMILVFVVVVVGIVDANPPRGRFEVVGVVSVSARESSSFRSSPDVFSAFAWFRLFAWPSVGFRHRPRRGRADAPAGKGPGNGRLLRLAVGVFSGGRERPQSPWAWFRAKSLRGRLEN